MPCVRCKCGMWESHTVYLVIVYSGARAWGGLPSQAQRALRIRNDWMYEYVIYTYCTDVG